MKKTLVIMLMVILFVLSCEQARWEDAVATAAEQLDTVKAGIHIQDQQMMMVRKALLDCIIVQLECVAQEIEEAKAYDGDEEVAKIYVTALCLIDESRALLKECEEGLALYKAVELDAIHNLESSHSVFEAEQGFTPPEKISAPEPVFPPMLKDAGWSGTCSIGLYIDEAGNIGKVWVIRSTGESEADQAAIEAAWASQWRPATQNGVPIAKKISVTYEFEINVY
ncbi:MAG: energy transducer TonB [bacterium]|nr:energy transducer TonB [bacterium]